jgi:hypothetical protein
MQQQTLEKRESQLNVNMENYVGLVSYLTDPFNLFLRLEDLENKDIDLVYFFVYSIGKKKIMLWGTYSKDNNDFHIEAACKYTTPQLMPIYRYWQNNNFRYIANVVVDRFTPKINEYLGRPGLMSMDEYKKKKFFLAFERGKIKKEDIDREIGKNYPEKLYDKLLLKLIEEGKLDEATKEPLETEVFQDELEEYLNAIEKELKDHEKKINRLDIDRNLEAELSEETISQLINITQIFLKKMERSSLNDDKVYAWLPQCPQKDYCKGGVDGTCGVYFYGTHILDPRDLR